MLTPRDVTGILRLGGTILGTINRGNPFAYPIETSDGTRDYSDRVIEMFHKMGLGALVVIGGDGTLAIAHQFCCRGIPIVGVPKTIDNDIVGTTNCFGFDTAVAFATDAIDRLHTTAEAHKRIMVVEVMGRYAGWIALYAGVAGGADAILIPGDSVRPRHRRRSGCASATAGAPSSASSSSRRARSRRAARRRSSRRRTAATSSGSAASARRCARRSREATGKETRSVVLGHLQRGGAPTSFDRVLATRFGGKAVELVRRGEFGTMVAFAPPDIVARRLEDVVGKTKTVPLDFDLLLTARALGVTFGD